MADLNLQYGQFGLQQPQVDVPGLSGYAQGQALNQFQQNRGLQNLLNQLMIQANQEKMKEYGLNAPVREQERQAAIETTLPRARTEQGTREEELIQQRIETPVKRAQAGGKIDKEKLDQMERDVEKFSMALPTFQGPTAISDFDKWAEDNDLPKTHPYRKHISGSTSPEDMQKRSMEVLNHATMNIAQRRQQQQTMMTTGSQERQADIAGQYSLERQRLANEASERAAQLKSDKEKRVDKLEGDMIRTMEEMDKVPEGSAAYKKLETKLNRLFQMSQAIRAAGAPYIPNVNIGGQPLMQQRQPQPLPGQQAAPIQWERGPDGKPRPIQR